MDEAHVQDDGYLERDLTGRIKAIFAIFYVDDRYIALKDAEFFQEALDILVETLKRVGLTTNTKKLQAMV